MGGSGRLRVALSPRVARACVCMPRRRLGACRSTQVLTWLVLPFFQYYAVAGNFTIKGK